MLINTGTLIIIEVGMWYLALKSLKKTEGSIKDTNNQDAVSNQRDRWKVSLSAYRKLMKASNDYSMILNKSINRNIKFQHELKFFSFVIDWVKEYLLFTDLIDKKLINRCAGPQLRILYRTYTEYFKDIPGYLNDINVFKSALIKCDIL